MNDKTVWVSYLTLLDREPEHSLYETVYGDVRVPKRCILKTRVVPSPYGVGREMLVKRRDALRYRLTKHPVYRWQVRGAAINGGGHSRLD